MPEPVAYPTNLQLTEPGINASIWSSEPMLGEAPGQQYHGRLVVDVWDKGESVFYNQSVSKQMLREAIASLENVDEHSVIKATSWSDDPIMGTQLQQTFRGRLVLELWDSQVAVAITGSYPVSAIAKQALQKICQEFDV